MARLYRMGRKEASLHCASVCTVEQSAIPERKAIMETTKVAKVMPRTIEMALAKRMMAMV